MIVLKVEDMKSQDAINKVIKSQLKTVQRLYTCEDQLEGARESLKKCEHKWKGR